MKLVAGVDGGQSSTVALVAGADGTVLGRGRAGPADDVGERTAAQRSAAAIDAALDAAVAAAGCPLDQPLEAVVAAVSGYDVARPDRRIPLRERALRVEVEHDADAAWRGAFGSGAESGILVIAGTGSAALGRCAGEVVRAGGWGYVFGDAGSAFWLARRALSMAMESDDRGASLAIGAAALRHFGVDSLRAVAHGFARRSIDRTGIAAFARRVGELAAAGDPAACALRGEAAVALADLCLAVDARLTAAPPRRFSYHGGMFEDAALREIWIAKLAACAPGSIVCEPLYEPAYGALLRACELARSGLR